MQAPATNTTAGASGRHLLDFWKEAGKVVTDPGQAAEDVGGAVAKGSKDALVSTSHDIMC